MSSEKWKQEDAASRAKGPGNRGSGDVPKGKQAEALAAQQKEGSNWGKHTPGRPTLEDILNKVDGAENVPFDALPPTTQEALQRHQLLDGQRGMFAGEDGGDHNWKGAGASQPFPKEVKPTL